MTSELCCLVPLRSPGVGKTRLAPALGPDERGALAAAMLADVTSALERARVGRIVVVAAGEPAVATAAALGLDVVVDPPDVADLDDALARAAARLGSPAALLVVHADLPRLTAGDVDSVLAADAAVVVAPTTDGGTSVLLRRPAEVIGTAYGRDSATAHVRLAVAAGVPVECVDRPGLAHDVDTFEDLRRLEPAVVGPATRGVLWDVLPSRPASS